MQIIKKGKDRGNEKHRWRLNSFVVEVITCQMVHLFMTLNEIIDYFNGEVIKVLEYLSKQFTSICHDEIYGFQGCNFLHIA